MYRAVDDSGFETMGDLNNFVKEHGPEKVDELVTEMFGKRNLRAV